MTEQKVSSSNNKAWLIAIAVLLVLSLILTGVNIASNKADKDTSNLATKDDVVVLGNAMIQGFTDVKNSIPTQTAATPEVLDNDKVSKLCKLADGCEYYKISGDDEDEAVALVSAEIPESKDFIRAFASLVEIDKDYLEIDYADLKDSKVIALTEQDKEDGNYKVQLFYKVSYKDEDATDYEKIYILVTSVLDEGEYEDLSIEEVERTFEF